MTICDFFMPIAFSCSGDIYYTSVLEEMAFDGQDFKADSWSMAVDSTYLQTHRKNVIKRQDVIYGDRIILLLVDSPLLNRFARHLMYG